VNTVLNSNECSSDNKPEWSQADAISFEVTQEVLNRVVAWCVSREASHGKTNEISQLIDQAWSQKKQLQPTSEELLAVKDYWVKRLAELKERE